MNKSCIVKLTTLVIAVALLRGAPVYAAAETTEDPTPHVPTETIVTRVETRIAPARTITVYDPKTPKGTRTVIREAVDGQVRCVTQARYVDGVLRERKTVSAEVTRTSVDGIVEVGTWERPEWWPTGELACPVTGIVTSEYGDRGGEFHTGIDIAAEAGTPVCAADGGEVTFAGWQGGYGWYVVIDHGDMETCYAHNETLLVEAGDCVQKGQPIASMGSTGRSTGPHCHFEVRVDGESREPRAYVEIPEGGVTEL